MKKFERLYYFAIILIEVCLIIFLSIKLTKYKNFQYFNNSAPGHNKIVGLDRLYSFWAENILGEKELIQFTAYSARFYIFGVFSNQCPHCEVFINEFASFFINMNLDNDIELVLLTRDPIDQYKRYSPLKFLKLSLNDIFQFGMEVPAMMVVNGKGEVLLKGIGYRSGMFEKLLDAVNRNKNRVSKKIE